MAFTKHPGFVEASPDEPLLGTAEDARLILEACFSSSVGGALLYARNLPPSFFDLSSGVAGAVLQKLRNYRVRLAVVCPPGEVQFSRRFAEMAEEEARTGQFKLFDSAGTARGWLNRTPDILAE